jgi:hypothetical protein
MRFTLLLTLLLSFSSTFSFSQSREKTPETRIVNGKKHAVVKNVETDKSKIKMLSPDNSKKVIVGGKKTVIIEPKKK